MITLSLPFPPTTNHYWRHVPIGQKMVKVYISAKGKAFIDEVARIIAAQDIPEQKGQLFARYDLYPPSKHRRDIDNYDSKAINDALTKAGLLSDDSQIRGKISWFHDDQVKKPGALVVHLTSLDSVREIYEPSAII